DRQPTRRPRDRDAATAAGSLSRVDTDATHPPHRLPVHVVDHPLAQARLTALRDARTDSGAFRAALHELTTMLVYEATRSFPVEHYAIDTPVAPTDGSRLANPPLLVAVLRGGPGMAVRA